MERRLPLSPEQRERTILRTDAGFGGDDKVNRALDSHWQVLTKGKGGRRPHSYASRIAQGEWQLVGNNRWLAPAINPVQYVRPTRHLVLRWITPAGLLKYATLVSSITEWSDQAILDSYDDRGQCETEIQSDKGGLKIEKRRKRHLYAQEALILLTDVAHNLLAWTSRWMFPPGTPYACFGSTRLVEDVFAISGRLIFQDDHLLEIQLNKNHPYAEETRLGLFRLLDHFGFS